MDYFLKPTGATQSDYVDYLVKRLTEFREAGRGFGQKFSGSNSICITRKILQSQLGGALNDESRFEEICSFIKAKIDNTILGRRNASLGRHSYHEFSEHGKSKTVSPTESGDTKVRDINIEPSVSRIKQGNLERERTNSATDVAGVVSLPSVDENPEVRSQKSEVRSDAQGTARPTLSEHQFKEANNRRLILLAAEPLFAASMSQVAVATACGVDDVYLCRLLSLAGAGGTRAERCRRLISGPVEALAPKESPGRGSAFATLLQVPEIVAEMNRLYTATMGASCEQATRDRRTGSIATTLKRLGDFALVPEALAGKLRAGSQPKPLVAYIKNSWTPEIEAKFRGQKHYSTATISGRRDLVEELADGSRVPLQPGRVWVFDDMSSNMPFWFEAEVPPPNDSGAQGTARPTFDKGLRQLVERHGCALGRQGLYAWDWASGAWLGLELVGRLRDAYQASDILRFIRKLVQQYGKPEKIVLERGVWKARAISGWKAEIEKAESGNLRLVEIEDGWEIPEMAGDETARINDGIRALGIEIIHAYTPRGKPIEGAFNYHQTLVPTFLKQGEAVNIGRHAGEFEWSARQHRRASNGVLHPRELGFIHIDRLADVSWEAMLWEGQHDKARRNGKPLEILSTWLNTSPLPQATERDLAVFLPEKRNGMIRDGHLSAAVNGVHHDFLHPEIFARLGDGARVDYAFDPAEPTLGAAVYGEKGYVCWASYLEAGPVISARDRSGDEAPQLIKRYKLAHRTAARMLDLKSLRTVKFYEARSQKPEVSPESIRGSSQNEIGTRGTRPSEAREMLTASTNAEFMRRRERLVKSGARARELMEQT